VWRSTSVQHYSRRSGYILPYIHIHIFVYSDVGTYELLWVRVEAVVIGALYHPPRPQYAVESLVDYIEACVEEVGRSFPQALVILAGDFNQLSTNVLRERTGLTPLVDQPTRGANILDQILVSWPKYSKVHVLASLVSSDHKSHHSSWRDSSTRSCQNYNPANIPQEVTDSTRSVPSTRYYGSCGQS